MIEIVTFKRKLAKVFEIKDLRDISYFLKVRIIRNRHNRTITLIQNTYTKRIINAKSLRIYTLLVLPQS